MKLQIVNALYALAQDSRLAIFRILVQAGPAGLAAGDIARAVGTSRSLASFHTMELLEARMATSRADSSQKGSAPHSHYFAGCCPQALQ